MSNKKEAIYVLIKNQTVGGGDRYYKKVKGSFRKYKTTTFSPKKMEKVNGKIHKLFNYIWYVYFYLPNYYSKIATKISKDVRNRVIVFQDAYIKCPNVFSSLKNKSIYILHEPPREFYEPLHFHAPSIKSKLFTAIIRTPIALMDQLNTRMARQIISNSLFSSHRIKEIYGKDSRCVYPGKTVLGNNKYERISNQCLSMGSLLPYKGHDIAIRSIGKIEESLRPGLVIVGSGSQKDVERLEKIALISGVHITIISHVDDAGLEKLYRQSKVYVNCAFQEPFGMTSLEAITHGCNLVTVNKCGTAELKRFFPKNVIVVNREEGEIASAIMKSLKVSGKQKIEWKSWDDIRNEFISMLS